MILPEFLKLYLLYIFLILWPYFHNILGLFDHIFLHRFINFTRIQIPNKNCFELSKLGLLTWLFDPSYVLISNAKNCPSKKRYPSRINGNKLKTVRIYTPLG